MKQLLIILSVIMIISPAVNGQKTTGKTQATKTIPAKPPVILKTLNDSVSYAIGTSVANFYKEQGVKKLNTALVSKAINDILSGKPSLIEDAQANNLMNRYMMQLQQEKAKDNIAAGEAFLNKNKLRPEVKTTASGLQYEVITETAGAKPAISDTFICNYRGTFINGTEFDASFNRGEPLVMPLNKVIAGWTEGMQLMSVGSKYKFYVPYQLGYGPFDYNTIPGGSALVFEIELLGIKKKD
jgi:FKBP-type peptidyl-prolyl cis-trans isomerase